MEHLLLDAALEDLLVGHEDDLGARAGLLDHARRQVDDANALRRADVEDPACRGRLGDERVERADRVRDVAEGASARRPRRPLVAAGEGRLHETRMTIPYWPSCRGPRCCRRRSRTEGSRRSGPGRGTRRSPWCRRRPTGARSSGRRYAAHLHGEPTPRDGHRRPRSSRRSGRACRTGSRTEDALGSLDTVVNNVPWPLDDQAHADHRGEVVDDVATVHELADDRRREHRIDNEMEPRPIGEMEDIALRARREIVEGEDLCPRVEQELERCEPINLRRRLQEPSSRKGIAHVVKCEQGVKPKRKC